MPQVKPDDLMKIAIGHTERLTSIEGKQAIDHERIGVLEKQASNMSQMPATVAALGQKVESMNSSFIREVDGLREQQKAHKKETIDLLQNGFRTLGEAEALHRSALETKIVNAIAIKDAKEAGWWQIIDRLGKILLSVAIIAEAIKAYLH
jgi:hypothetical protein